VSNEVAPFAPVGRSGEAGGAATDTPGASLAGLAQSGHTTENILDDE
jgi:hypothetical protein